MAKTGPKPDFDVKEMFDYKEGKLLWKHSKKGGRRSGSEVGYGAKEGGYKWVKIGERYFLIHRLVYFFHTNKWPDLIDHIDCDKRNNRIENLREATKSINGHNVKELRSNNRSGFKGVYWSQIAKKWAAQYTVNRKTIYIGVYDDPVDAAKAIKTYLKQNQPEKE